MVTEHGLEIQINNIISEPFLSKLIASYSVLIISIGLQSLPTIPRPWKNRMYGCIKSNGHLTDFLRGIINLARTTKVETMTQIRTLQEENKYILTLNVLPFSSIFISFSIQPLLFKGQFMCCPPYPTMKSWKPRATTGESWALQPGAFYETEPKEFQQRGDDRHDRKEWTDPKFRVEHHGWTNKMVVQ